MRNNTMNICIRSTKALIVGLTALTVLSASAGAAQHMKKMMDHDNMDHSKMKMGDMKKAAPAKIGDLTISGPWARQSFGKAVNSAGFMVIKNMGATDDRLIDASSPISKRTELHTHIKEGDIMKMRRVRGGIPIPKNGSTALQPGGLHVMFIGLKEPLKAGTTFPVTLKFKQAGEVTLNITARKMAPSGKMNHGAMDHGKMPRGSN